MEENTSKLFYFSFRQNYINLETMPIYMSTQELVFGDTGTGKTHYVNEKIEENEWEKVEVTEDEIEEFDLRGAVTSGLSGERAFVFENFENYGSWERGKVRDFVESTSFNVFVVSQDENVGKRLKNQMKKVNVEKNEKQVKSILRELAEEIKREIDNEELNNIVEESGSNIAFGIAKLRNPNIEISQEEEYGLFQKLGVMTSNINIRKSINQLEDVNEQALLNWVEATYGPRLRGKNKKQFLYKLLTQNDKIVYKTDSDYFYSSMIFGVRSLDRSYRWNYPSKPDNHQKDQIISKLQECHTWSEDEARQNYPYFRELMNNDYEFKCSMIKKLELSKSDCDYLGVEYEDFDNEPEEGIVEEKEEETQKAMGLGEF